ncbi:MAG TPA: DinB family protein [Polyangiales bacterium]|nr:DinB family protein [Polyangiales bacterium]
MTPEICRAYARYNGWMNAKIYNTAALLSDEERKRDRGAFFGSIHNVMNHLLVADRIWVGRLVGRNAEPGFIGPDGIKSLDQELASDFEELRRQRDKTDAAIADWAGTVTSDALAGDLRMFRKGQWEERPLWWAVTQMFNHQTHHRGQISTLLFQAGHDPGATDLFAMLIEEARSATSAAPLPCRGAR